MTKTQQAAIVGVAAALGWLTTQRVREEIPGIAGVGMGAFAGIVVQSAVSTWLEDNV